MNTEPKSSVIRDRLIILCETLGLSRREFSVSIGRAATYVTSLNKDITSGVLNNILIKYPQINIMWIITGKGDILLQEKKSDDLYNHLIEENRELKMRNEELNRELGRLEEKVVEMKKTAAHQDISAGCADASGSGLTIY